MGSQRGHTFERRRRASALVMVITALSLQFVGATGAGAAPPGPTEVLSAFGANTYGELGNNSTANALSPVAVSGIGRGVVAFAAAARHDLAILPDTSVVAWGRNDSGELGIGNNTGPSTSCSSGTSACSLVPVPVEGVGGSGTLTGAVAVDGGAPACSASIPCTSHAGHSMALLGDGTVLGWGHGNSGEVGDGVSLPIPSLTNHDVLHPVVVAGLGTGSGVVAIAAGASHSLALKSDGSVLSWGNNKSGELGTGGALPGTDASTPQAVTTLGASVTNPVVSIAAGDGFSVALKKDGSVWTWGNNASGQLGNGTAGTDSSTPGVVNTLGPNPTNPVIAISAGSAFVVALRKSQTVVAWGNNTSGELGNNTTSSSVNPVTAVGATGIIAIAAGSAHVIAMRPNGTVFTWGHGSSGQLGNGSVADVLAPKALALRGVTHIAAGGGHTLIESGPTVNPVTPIIAKAGTHVGITGVRFGPSESLTVVYRTGLVSPAQLVICTTTTSSTGAFSCPLSTTAIPTVNSGWAGLHTLVATGGTSGVHASASFTLVPTVTISPASGHAGAAVTVAGSHFKAGEVVTVRYATGLAVPATQTLCTPTATSTGTISCASHIPTTNAGPLAAHKITATGSVTKLAGSTTFTLK